MWEKRDAIGNVVDLSHLNQKVELLLDATLVKGTDFNFHQILNFRGGAATVCALALIVVWKIVRRHAGCYVVACNQFTTRKLNNLVKTRENVVWAVYVGLGVGVVSGVIATHVDTVLFG
jgi:hypothetical protein